MLVLKTIQYFEYDGSGLLARFVQTKTRDNKTDTQKVVTYLRDSGGSIQKEERWYKGALDGVATYTYNANNSVLHVAYPSGEYVEYYKQDNRIVKMRGYSGEVFLYTYNSSGNVTEEVMVTKNYATNDSERNE